MSEGIDFNERVAVVMVVAVGSVCVCVCLGGGGGGGRGHFIMCVHFLQSRMSFILSS